LWVSLLISIERYNGLPLITFCTSFGSLSKVPSRVWRKCLEERDRYLQVAPDGALFFNEPQILYTDRRSAALSDCSACLISRPAVCLLILGKAAESKTNSVR